MALNERDILGGKAIIFQNDFEVWQFRCWISEEKKYVRQSLKTKDEYQAVDLAEELFYGILTVYAVVKRYLANPSMKQSNRFSHTNEVRLALVMATQS